LSRPFPHTDAFNPADGLPDPPSREDFNSEEKLNEAEDAYWQHHEAVVFAPEHSIGLLYLCHLGCAYREALVVSGPARGQMWADDTASDGGFGRYESPTETPQVSPAGTGGGSKKQNSRLNRTPARTLRSDVIAADDRALFVPDIRVLARAPAAGEIASVSPMFLFAQRKASQAHRLGTADPVGLFPPGHHRTRAGRNHPR
jgi:hypothetical protein